MLEPQDTQKLLALPPDFIEEVREAHKKKHFGRLSLLASEVEGFHWKIPALRLIGEKLFSLRAFESARITWEKIRKQYPDDPEANLKLATIYQRLAEEITDTAPGEASAFMDKSDQAIETLMKSEAFEEREIRAETWSLKGRNEKTKWIQSWIKYPEPERAVRALNSGYLTSAFENYKKAYNEDLNHFYSGINTLGLLTVIIQLAKVNPAAWEFQFDSEEDARRELDDFIEMHEEISVTVRSAVNAQKMRLKEAGKTDPWLQITEADLVFLTSKDPARVEVFYQRALASFSGNEFNTFATARQVRLYGQLGVLPDNVKAAMSVLPAINAPVKERPVHHLLFTGHMIDKAGRTTPRFPENKETEVRLKIKEEIQKIKSLVGEDIIGIAGGACGGDTIFHETCQELGIRSEIYLALSRDMFIVESVQFAGYKWVDRFNRLYQKLPVHFLAESKEMPKWLHKKKNYTIWERNNLWELNSALVNGGINMTLLALWDEKGGDGPGGTADMVKQSQARGAKTIIIPIG
jgi:tetratricopeptide (TPR) repeat protein